MAMGRQCEIWAVGSGKGGTGKSFLTSSLGAVIARNGKRVALIDADLGGANLHSFLGIGRPRYSLTDFFEKKMPLNKLIVDYDSAPNIGIITGDIDSITIQDFALRVLESWRNGRKNVGNVGL